MKKFFVGKPNIPDKPKVIQRLESVTSSGWISNNGEQVKLFEKEFAKKHGFQHAIAMTNASLALELTLSLLPPGEVIIPAFTFVATLQAVIRAGHRPVFVDVNGHMQMDLNHCLDRINEDTVAIVPVNLFGGVVDPKSLNVIYQLHSNVAIIHDSAHCTGMNMEMLPADAHIFSLHATKAINSAEGGMVCTNDPELARQCRAVRNFGYDMESEDPEGEFLDPFPDLATNAKMSEYHAAIGRTNLESADTIIEHNKKVFGWYKKYLKGSYLLEPHAYSNFSYIIVLFNMQDREKIYTALRAKGVYVRKYFNYVVSLLAGDSTHYENAVSFKNSVLAFPTGLQMTEADVAWICKTLEESFKCLR